MKDEELEVEELEEPEDEQPQDEPESPEKDQGEGEAPEETDDPETDEDELEVSFDEKQEPEEPKSSRVLNDLRGRHRNLKKKYRKALHRLEELEKPEQSPTDPGPKPTLESCDYDSDQYEKKIDAWYDKKRQADLIAEKTAAKKQSEENEQRQIYANYSERKAGLRVKDYAEAEEEVIDQLDITKQNVILKYAKKPELIVYALGKSPAKLAELAKLDAFEFAKELGRLEDNLKVGKRKPKTKPEKTIQSTGSLSGTTDRTLEKLREEAAKTGNMSKVMAYKRKKRRAAG